MSATRNIVKTLIPKPILIPLEKLIMKIRWSAYARLSTQEIFTKIYADNAWGDPGDRPQRFCSGRGSRDGVVATTYFNAIHALLSSFPQKPNAVDLGCGDFFIGSRVRGLCGSYTACDIVEPLIAYNKEKYAGLNVDFRVLDITKDELPNGEIAFVRQVLQHLSNAQIADAVLQMRLKYKYLVVTEHLPMGNRFSHNSDQAAGPDNRVQVNSGIVLTSPPFNLAVVEERVLCEVLDSGGVIRTTFYKLT